eukprot:COSAG04_NODE_1950_length_5152_cov_1.766080_4_plen_230_part_01
MLRGAEAGRRLAHLRLERRLRLAHAALVDHVALALEHEEPHPLARGLHRHGLLEAAAGHGAVYARDEADGAARLDGEVLLAARRAGPDPGRAGERAARAAPVADAALVVTQTARPHERRPPPAEHGLGVDVVVAENGMRALQTAVVRAGELAGPVEVGEQHDVDEHEQQRERRDEPERHAAEPRVGVARDAHAPVQLGRRAAVQLALLGQQTLPPAAGAAAAEAARAARG